MKVIDRDTVKFYLDIGDDSLDAAIDAQLPIIDSKVKQICRHSFNTQMQVAFETGNLYVQLLDYAADWTDSEFMAGTLLEGEGLEVGSYIDEVYPDGYNDTNIGIAYIRLSEVPIATKNVGYIFAGINKAYQQTIAKGVQWLIEQTGTKIPQNTWTSKSGAGLSVSRSAADEKIDGKSGMPAWFVKSLPRYQR